MKKAQVIFLVCFALLVFIANLPEEREPTPPFPKPDPSKGTSLGYDFNKGDYRYASEYPRANAVSSKRTTIITESSEDYSISVYRLEDIKDIDDLKSYINKNQKYILLPETDKYDLNEDDIDDLRDYLGH